MKMSFALMVAMLTNSLVAGDVYTVPLPIRDFLKKYDCSGTLEHYSDWKGTESPYMYRVVSAATGRRMENDNSFISWCRATDENAEMPYVLVSKLDKAVWPGGCGFPIRGFDYPGGLKIVRKHIDLDAFDEFRRKSGESSSVFGPVIVSESDGLVYEIFCQRGTWLKRNID